ncbi:uncharacterized protein LOC123525482 [Mercenaria mercenaria]|uniref:uncharacterized protein LOC123525482 n=1 Tax=Mercenaria mercenaria TaxID=6596 RepID=UPI001E1D6B13|nr:uncharacterized protein LOC123525482 [Mercenaria mercenaria]
MVDFHVTLNVAMVIAAVLGELVSFFFYNHHSAWGRSIGERYLLSAIVCDAVLVVVIKWIMGQYFTIRNWEDAAILAFWLSLIFFALEAPHVVHDHRSLSYFLGHWLHKFCVLFVMIFALFYFRNY